MTNLEFKTGGAILTKVQEADLKVWIGKVEDFYKSKDFHRPSDKPSDPVIEEILYGQYDIMFASNGITGEMSIWLVGTN